MASTTTKTATHPYVVEVFQHGDYRKSRKFRTREAAVAFANDWSDRHYDEGGWQCQLVHAGVLHQFGVNGNDR
jgi:hypothetical protein